MFCKECGNEISDSAVMCVKCGVPTPNAADASKPTKSRVSYVLLGIFLGGLGIHNFYAGYTGRGIAQLLIVLFTGWLIVPALIVGLWALIEVCVVTQDAQGRRLA